MSCKISFARNWLRD